MLLAGQTVQFSHYLMGLRKPNSQVSAVELIAYLLVGVGKKLVAYVIF